MRSLFLVVAVAASCTAQREAAVGGPSVEAGNGQRQMSPEADLDRRLRDVLSVRTAAEDALAQSRRDEPLWEDARLSVPTPFVRTYFEGKLAAYARSRGLNVSGFTLAPMTAPRLEYPGTIDPSDPYPVRARDAILEVPLRFSLRPVESTRVEAFLSHLPEMGLLFLVDSVEQREDRVDVGGRAFTFRQIEPIPTYVVNVPPRDVWLREQGLSEMDGDLENVWSQLEIETRKTNEVLANLSRVRLQQVRAEAWLPLWRSANESVSPTR